MFVYLIFLFNDIIGSTSGYADGVGNIAQFYSPYDVKSSPDGSIILVADYTNNLIRQITCTSGYNMSYGTCIKYDPLKVNYVSNIIVKTFAGVYGSTASASGVGNTTKFSGPSGLCIDPSNPNIFYVINYDGKGLHKLYYPSAVGIVLISTSRKFLSLFFMLNSNLMNRYKWTSKFMYRW